MAPVQPNAVVQQAAQAQTVAPIQPIAPAHSVAPAQQAAPTQPNAVVQQAAQAQTVAPTQPIAPAQPVAPAQQATPAQPAASAQQTGFRLNGASMNRARLRRSVSPRDFRRLTTQLRRNHTAAQPAPELSLNQYHEIADSTMGSLLWQLEEIESEREDMEVEEAVSPPYLASQTSLTAFREGRSHQNDPRQWTCVRHQQAASEQADLALLAHLRAQTLRLPRGPLQRSPRRQVGLWPR